MVSEEDLVLEFEVPIEPCFTNAMYMGVLCKTEKRKSGYWATTARTPQLKRYQSAMKDYLPTCIPEDKVKKFKYAFDTGVYDIEVVSTHYIYYKRFYDMDASNLIKAHEDCVSKFLGIDDSFTSKYTSEKVPTEVDNGWLVKTRMVLVKRHPICIR